jgi:hypothetical protein
MSKARVAVLHVVSGQLSITDQQSEDNRLLFDSASEFVFGLHYPGAATPLVKNFEQWLSYLVESPPWLSPSAQVRNRAAFLDVSKAVETVMERRQLMMLLEQVGQERQGAEGCPRWLQRLVREWERYRTKVITFNYDQLVELAWLLYTKDIRGKSSDRSSSRDLYPVVLTPLTARGGHGTTQVYMVRVVTSCMTGDSAAMGGTPLPILPPPTLSVTDLEPMVVPPATIKSPYYGNNVLRSLWTSAALHLRNAKEVVIMGFSLPATDMLVSSMLCTSA